MYAIIEPDPSGRALCRCGCDEYIPLDSWRVGFLGSGRFRHYLRLDHWLARGGTEFLRTTLFTAMSENQLRELGLVVESPARAVPPEAEPRTAGVEDLGPIEVGDWVRINNGERSWGSIDPGSIVQVRRVSTSNVSLSDPIDGNWPYALDAVTKVRAP
jgi:hypothetical protein